ncbi:hypothetical protein GCM10007049_36020 [Echinicola pacifica]|uniref:SusD family protein n=1 Tax=Echinicola pacifica TaxID=346377 RepID=A0A918UX62_9BACT|nr:RagB/SusD family nutrient uptake outer membrane protein [Echinicola pacifica]GGZ39529.1 hypothetical protein GCM10007049_36020 [Echinicola pacifica]
MKLKNIIYTSAVALVAFGCSEDFLETQPTEQISTDRVEEISVINPSLQLSVLKGVYSTMYQVFSASPDDELHDDFGQKGYDIFSDMLSGDMVLSAKGFGWYAQVSDLQVTINNTNIRNYLPWRYYYKVIFGANAVIDGLGGTDAVPETEVGRQIMAQAKALRAYGYFYLANFFAEEYNPSDIILPVYTSIDQEAQPFSSTEDVYNLILSDLNFAIENLENYNRTAKFEVNTDIARALLAYTHAAMGNNTEAATVTQAIIDNSTYNILTNEELTTNGFNNIQTSGWMWGVDITLDMDMDLVSWWGQVDPFTYSYAWVGDGKVINADLYNAIPVEDGRKAQFLDRNGDGNPYWAMNKFFDPGRTIGGQRSITTDYVYMRIEEIYLLNAETAAKSGDETGAKTSLKAVMSERVPDTSYIDGLSGQALLDEIILQTRIELWGEGKSYLLMKRNKSTITLGSNHLTYPGLSIPYNDDQLTFEIPDQEIVNNPNID